MATITVYLPEKTLRKCLSRYSVPPKGWTGRTVIFAIMQTYTPFADVTGDVHTIWRYEPLIDCHVFQFTLDE